MSEEKLGQEPIFPVTDPNIALAILNCGGDPTGISKRFYIACMAMQGYLSNPYYSGVSNSKICEMSYEISDIMLSME